MKHLLLISLLIFSVGVGAETIEYKDGGTYVGSVVGGKPSGYGTLVAPDGSKYVGQFLAGKYHGQGTYTWADSKTYVGEFHHGKQHGQGTYTRKDGIYIGEMRENKPWKGVIYFPSGGVWGTVSDGVYCEGCKPPSISVVESSIPTKNTVEDVVKEFVRNVPKKAMPSFLNEMRDKFRAAFRRGDYESAIQYLLPRASDGDPSAQANIALCYERLLQYAEAAKWYRKAADQNMAGAQISLGVLYQKGLGVGKDSAEAVKWWRMAAEAGYDGAQFNLGMAYKEGSGVAQNYSNAVRWFRKAAEQGLALAQFQLALTYRQGKGVDKDDSEAVKWYRRAAVQGDARAQHNLAFMYATGAGVSQDYTEMMKWYEKALMNGHDKAAWNIASQYSAGIGVPKDAVAQYAYANVAQALGLKTAHKWMRKNEHKFTEYERTNGQRMAAQIWAKINAVRKGQPRTNTGRSGTGFIINKQGYVVTNKHVVTDCNRINTVQNSTKTLARIVVNDEKNDLAVLKTTNQSSFFARFRARTRAMAGEGILAFGYPLKSVLSDELKGTSGMINALSGLSNDIRFMQMSAPVQPGNSGGPLLDQAGNVVGVVTAKMNAVKMAKHTGDIPQNVNFALKALLIRDMLEVNGIDYETASSQKKMETVDIFSKAKQFTVLVECLQ